MSSKIILKLGALIGALALVLVALMYGIAPLLPGAGQLGYSREAHFYVLDVGRSIQLPLLESRSQPLWSPDGDQLVYVNRAAPDAAESIVISQMFQPNSRIVYPAQAVNGVVTHSPAWSPFNSQIAFIYAQEGAKALDLVVLEANSGASQVENIAGGISQDTALIWTAADRLRYVSVDTGVVRLNELRLNEAEPIIVRAWPFDTMAARQAALSADGTRFILPAIVPHDLNFELYLFDVNTDEIRNLSNRSTHNDTNPVWSPDEQHILFRSLTDSGQYLVMMNPDGSDQQTLFHVREGLFNQVNWSPDGQQVSYVLNQSGNKRLCIFRAADGAVNCPARDVDQASWRPNS